MSWTSDPWEFPLEEDPDETKQYIIHVHGWRMDYAETQNWAQTTFKRLWHHGYKGRFATFRWPTLSSETDPIFVGRLTYNDSEYRAWLSGPAFASYVNSLPASYSRYLMAHSMGNVVVGAAFHGTQPGSSNGQGMTNISRYAMFNAAMAHMAYGSPSTQREFSTRMTPDTDSDPQTFALGLLNKFNPIATQTFNFYLTADYALDKWSFNQEHNKPDNFLTFFTDRQWNYFPNFPNNVLGFNIISPPNLPSAGNKLWYEIELGNANGPGLSLTGGRVVTGLPEAMAHVTQARTKPAGNTNFTGGSVTSVPMDDYGFGTEHSAEWNLSIQKTDECFNELLVRFGLHVEEN